MAQCGCTQGALLVHFGMVEYEFYTVLLPLVVHLVYSPSLLGSGQWAFRSKDRNQLPPNRLSYGSREKMIFGESNYYLYGLALSAAEGWIAGKIISGESKEDKR